MKASCKKSESLHLDGLSPVRSTKAARLKRIKPGYFNPPGGRPVFVPGWHWLSVILLGMSGRPTLATMRWWSTQGEQATRKREVEEDLLRDISERWGQKVIHVWDRGFAGTPWLTMAFVHALCFVMRWPKNYKLCPDEGPARPVHHIPRGKRSWGHRLLWDARRREQRKVGVLAIAVRDPAYDQLLTLVVARRGKGQSPWYLLTGEPVCTEEEAWRIVLIYARRWQVEMGLRFN
ncbi:MAG: transposase [Candidatus Promineifilaceae bacterium]|nr:transposase [Candidatus Promineifilaceae bacterium]